MMFTLSAPALAESTNALMQLSINSRSSIARLNEQNSIPENAKVLDIAAGDIKVTVSNGVQYVVQGNGSPEECSALVVSGESTQYNLTIKGDSGTAANVYLNNLKITSNEAAVSVSGDVVLIVEGESELHSGDKHAGVEKANDNGTLTITGSGKLSAYGGEGGAGIGGASGKPGNNITINGGTITASGKAGNGWGAGIGGGKGQGGSNITIRGGNVKAIPGAEAAGIGGGFKGDGTNISIEGGTVYAESGGGNGGTAAIGGGRAGGNGENILITGGDITLKKAGAADIGIGGKSIEKSVADTFSGTLTYLDENGAPDADKNIVKYGITVNGEEFNSLNKDKILNGALRYDPATKTLSLNKSYTDAGSYMGTLTINAPKTNVDLNGGTYSVLQGKLVIEDAADVTLTSTAPKAIFGDANITCAGKLSITCENIAVDGNLTVNNASSVELIGKSRYGGTVTGAAVFNDTGEVTIRNTDDNAKGAAGSIRYSGDYVYSTAEGGALTDPRITPITADANYLYIVRSELHKVNVPEGCTVTLDGKNFDVDGKNFDTAHAGQTVTVTASADANHRFKGWKVTDGDVKLDDASQSTTSFVMGSKDVTLTASYADLYDIKVENGTASAEKAEVNETVDVQAVKPADPGKEFSGWKIVEHKSEGKGTFADAASETTTFTLTEAGKVTLKAMYRIPREITADQDTVTLTKTGGQPVMTKFFKGDTVQAVAKTVQGKLFDHWEITFGDKAVTLADIGLKKDDLKNNSTINFTVPASSVNLTAVYKESRGLTLENATIVSVMRNGAIVTDPTEFFAGDVITLAPDNSDSRYQFVRWDVEGIAKTDLTVDENTNNATFTMPDTDVKIHARRNRLFTVSVDNGSVTKGTGIPGTEVTATATVGENQKFDHWEVTFADKDVKLADIGLKKADLTNPVITFNIPKSNVSLKAVCKDMHTVKINGKEVRTEKVEGDSITINAAEAGVSLDKFERWKTNDLPLSEAELTNPSLTFTMPNSDVVLEIVEKETYTVTVNHGKANGAKTVDVKPGTEVTLTADTRTGYVFVGWKVETEDADGNPIVTVANAKNPTTSFIMPHGAVELTAEYEQLHTVTVNYKTDGGEENQHSEQKAIYGDKITVTANDRTAENLAFDHWEVTVDGLTVEDLLDDAKAKEAHFDMRRGEVVATAVYKKLHTISVHDGHAEVNGQTAEKAKEGDTVTVVPDTKLHKRFKSWKDDKGNTSLNGTTGTTFKMPNDAVDLTAEYVDLYALDVTYGTAYDADHNVVNEAAAGDKITVEADKAKPDQIFTGWTVAGVDLGEDQKNPSIEFDMPSGKVTLKANYSYVHDQKVTVKYGTEDNAEFDTTIYTPGNPVEITAKSRRSEDLVFDHWEVKQGTGVQLVDEKAESTSFIMPESAVEIVLVAHYEQLHKITINDGTATGGKLLEMADGKSVGAVKGAEITIEAAVKDNQVFDSWTVEQGDVTLADANSETTTFTMGEEEVVITANYKNLHKITVHGDAGDEELDYTETILNVKEGAKQEITAKEIDGKRFDHWVVNSENLTLTDDTENPLVIDAMPNSDLDLTAKYVDLYTLTVDNGTAYDKDNHIADEAAAGDSITVEADKLTGLESFVGWKLKAGTIIEITIKGETVSVSTDADGYLLDADGNKITAEKFTFTMPAGKVELQAVTSIPAYPMSFPVKILEGVAAGDTITTGGTVTVDGEPVQYTVKPGQTVKITADAPDERVYPGMVFDYWEIKSNVEVILDDANSETTTFTMPKGYVILTPHWASSAVVVNPDEPDPGFPVEPEAPAADGSGAVIGVAAAGAAIWGGYEITTRVILNDLLPEGAAIPTNRGELAMLIWTQKGKPEPAAEPDFTDVSDTELAKAAQWCVEQGLLTAEDGKFEPDGWTPKWRVIQVWNQAFPKE